LRISPVVDMISFIVLWSLLFYSIRKWSHLNVSDNLHSIFHPMFASILVDLFVLQNLSPFETWQDWWFDNWTTFSWNILAYATNKIYAHQFSYLLNDNESCILIRQKWKITEFNIWWFKKNSLIIKFRWNNNRFFFIDCFYHIINHVKIHT